ncbi:cereblon family protein [uncultured Desulfobacter sp.]|uniref:cereblon family protein n=1 Tax=uncultured Desulfobacter sp. TaxID=240139 RepID=UPI002AAA7D4A|nr:cereblon family protein [uncultured Desulfobacter sp.]
MALDFICKKTDRQIQGKSELESKHKFEPAILCKNCNAVVTKPEFAMLSEQGFSQAFANPAGIVFEIGCFSEASGCYQGSGPSSEFTWYPGYDWCIGICRNCTFHLGWIFLPVRKGPSSKFYGLILDHLIFP